MRLEHAEYDHGLDSLAVLSHLMNLAMLDLETVIMTSVL